MRNQMHIPSMVRDVNIYTHTHKEEIDQSDHANKARGPSLAAV